MTIAFIVHLEDEDPLDAPAIAADLQEALESQGFTVAEVKPWARPSTGLPAQNAFSPLGTLAGQPTTPLPPGP